MAHFYEPTESGVEARHFVPMATRPGDLRPTRITDVRKWWKQGRTVVPSVTTVLNVLDKAALVNWKVDQHLFQAVDLVAECSGNFNFTPEDFIQEVKRRTELEMDKAPQAGTDIHKVLEDFMRDGTVAEGAETICENVAAALMRHCGTQQWECEKRFASPLGFGGCIDLSSADWKVDYKTKQTADKFKPGKMAYPDHSRQLAAYRVGDNTPNARCANIFICIETGEVDFHEHAEDQLNNGWAVFEHALAIWQLINDYPMTETKAA